MKKEKPNLILSNSVAEDFIWMSYRYCIGRKTIAAYMHAETIANFIYKNPDVLDISRKIFMAEDIRCSIFDILKWNKFIKFENAYNKNRDWDFYSALLTTLSSLDNPNDYTYVIDMENETITYKELDIDGKKTAKYENAYDNYNDIINWIKLANLLDIRCHKNVIVDIDGKEKSIRCYPFAASNNNRFYLVWVSVDDVELSLQSYINPDKIIRIEDIND